MNCSGITFRVSVWVLVVAITWGTTFAQSPQSDTFVSLLQQAQAKTNAGEWAEAAALWEKVVSFNPVHGRFWELLAQARFQNRQYHEAIQAYEKALELQIGFPADQAYNIARCHAARGDKEQALRWLERAFELGYRRLDQVRNENVFRAFTSDLRFQQITATVDVSRMSRDEGWRYDVQLLAREVKRKGYAPFRHISREAFELNVQKIQESIPRLTDIQIVIELMKLMAQVGDGHTMIYGFWERPEFLQTIPVELSFFKEGLFVTAADSRFKELLGAQVLRFGNKTVEQILAALDPLTNRDNDMAPKVMGPLRMRNLPLLHSLGLIPDSKEVLLTVVNQTGVTQVVALPADSGISSRKLWDGLPKNWTSFLQTIPGPLPLYLKNQEADYWFEYVREPKMVYFQFNRVRNTEQESFAAFCDRLFTFLQQQDVEKLVIDMRWNNGGDTTLVPPLIHRLIRAEKISRYGQLFVIIGRRTFSAAQNAATLIERNTSAIFVGEPTGSSPNFIGEEIPFELPYSKLMANVSDLYWQSSWPFDYRTWIAPVLYAPPSFELYRANRDPALEAISTFGLKTSAQIRGEVQFRREL